MVRRMIPSDFELVVSYSETCWPEVLGRLTAVKKSDRLKINLATITTPDYPNPDNKDYVPQFL